MCAQAKGKTHPCLFEVIRHTFTYTECVNIRAWQKKKESRKENWLHLYICNWVNQITGPHSLFAQIYAHRRPLSNSLHRIRICINDIYTQMWDRMPYTLIHLTFITQNATTERELIPQFRRLIWRGTIQQQQQKSCILHPQPARQSATHNARWSASVRLACTRSFAPLLACCCSSTKRLAFLLYDYICIYWYLTC